jgi:hypothetical protein
MGPQRMSPSHLHRFPAHPLPPWDVCLFMGQFFLHAVCVAVERLCRILCSIALASVDLGGQAARDVASVWMPLGGRQWKIKGRLVTVTDR